MYSVSLPNTYMDTQHHIEQGTTRVATTVMEGLGTSDSVPAPARRWNSICARKGKTPPQLNCTKCQRQSASSTVPATGGVVRARRPANETDELHDSPKVEATLQ